MPSTPESVSVNAFRNFGELLRYLRTRARLTQRELSIAVGYSEAQISRLESNRRPPDLSAVVALFVPALDLSDAPDVVARLLELAAEARGEALPAHLTVTRTTRREVHTEVHENASFTQALPIPRTSFIGRERESEDVLRAFAESRLVAVIGPGGSGKTRLALHMAAHLADKFADGVCFVALAPLADPALVPTAVATALGLPAHDGAVVKALANALRSRHILLVLDNCEHVRDAAGQMAEALLAACAHLCVLITSREPLNIADETIYRLTPLPFGLATQLFVARAQLVLPDFALNDGNTEDVALICRRLDGMPLAIELAAARMAVLSTRQIAERLDDRFRLLTTPTRRQAEPRQQSLRLALDWSYDLLDPEERTLFAQLSVFAGGCLVEAIEAVCDLKSLDVLTSLVNKSLVTMERHGDSPACFGMLETVREYAREKLEISGETSVLRVRHLHHFAHALAQAEPQLHRSNQLMWLASFDAEHDNARAALACACDSDDVASIEAGYRLVSAMRHYWHVRGLHAERTAWMQRLLASPYQPALSAAQVCALADSCSWSSPERWPMLLDECLAKCQLLDEPRTLAYVRLNQAILSWIGADIARSRQAFNESLALYREVNDLSMIVHALAELAEFEQVKLDDRPSAKAHFSESAAVARELGDTRGIALALAHLGDLAIEQGDVAAAQTYCAEALSLSAELDDKEGMSWTLNGLSSAAFGLGNTTQAIQLGEESLRLSREWGGGWHVCIRTWWLARAVLLSGDHDRAIALLEENHVRSRGMNFDWGEAASLQTLGDICLMRGDTASARRRHHEAIELLYTGNYGYSLAYSLDSFAAIHAATSAWQRAAQLLDAADALRIRIHTLLLPVERQAREALIARINAQLDHAVFDATRRQGYALTVDEAIEMIRTSATSEIESE